MTGLGCGGEGVVFKFGGSLEFESGDEVVGGGEGNNYLIRSKRGDEGLGEDLIGGDASILRKGELIDGERKNADS